MVDGQVEVDDLGGPFLNGDHAGGGGEAVGNGDDGLTGGQGLDVAMLVNGCNLGVAGNAGDDGVCVGVIDDAQVKGAAHMQTGGGGGQDDAGVGVGLDGVAAVVAGVVAAKDEDVAGPLILVIVVLAGEGLLGVLVGGYVHTEGPLTHGGIVDHLGVEGIVLVHADLGVFGVAIGIAL